MRGRSVAVRRQKVAVNDRVETMSKPPPNDRDDPESPAVPGFRTWGGVYLFVFCAFAGMVILLTVFSEVFG